MYENGNGCEKDLKKALDLLTLSANKGCPDAINHLRYHIFEYIPILKEYPELWLSVIEYNGSLLRYIDNQTPEICMAAVQQHGCAILDVKEQTHEICMAAVQQNGRALKYVRKQTAIIINTAIAKDKDAKHDIHWSYWLKSLCSNLSFNFGFHSYTPIKTD
jgi:TPR repeat protein